MLLFNLSDNSIRSLKLSSMWLSKSLSQPQESELKTGLIQESEVIDQKGLAEQLKVFWGNTKINGEECAFILHDERAYTLRLDLPEKSDGQTVWELIKEQVSFVIPESFESLGVVYKSLGDKRGGGETQIAAVNRASLAKYLAVFEELGLRPRLAVPESYAIFVLISSAIKEGETIIYLDPEAKGADTIIMDEKGIIETFVRQDLETVKRFALEKWGRKIERVLGPENLGDLLQTYPIPLRFKIESAQLAHFASLLGLALLARGHQESFNLLS